MKTLERFLTENPSYVKCGNERIAKAAGISVATVVKFKKSSTFRNLNMLYRTTVS